MGFYIGYRRFIPKDKRKMSISEYKEKYCTGRRSSNSHKPCTKGCTKSYIIQPVGGRNQANFELQLKQAKSNSCPKMAPREANNITSKNNKLDSFGVHKLRYMQRDYMTYDDWYDDYFDPVMKNFIKKYY